MGTDRMADAAELLALSMTDEMLDSLRADYGYTNVSVLWHWRSEVLAALDPPAPPPAPVAPSAPRSDAAARAAIVDLGAEVLDLREQLQRVQRMLENRKIDAQSASA